MVQLRKRKEDKIEKPRIIPSRAPKDGGCTRWPDMKPGQVLEHRQFSEQDYWEQEEYHRDMALMSDEDFMSKWHK